MNHFLHPLKNGHKTEPPVRTWSFLLALHLHTSSRRSSLQSPLHIPSAMQSSRLSSVTSSCFLYSMIRLHQLSNATKVSLQRTGPGVCSQVLPESMQFSGPHHTLLSCNTLLSMTETNQTILYGSGTLTRRSTPYLCIRNT
jgi:hypothetical protein